MVEWMAAHRASASSPRIDYRETDHPPEFFWKAYRMAKRAGFRLTAHAGEFGCHWRNVETALDLLGVVRIDHGHTQCWKPRSARRAAERSIVFTVVPSNSNYSAHRCRPNAWRRTTRSAACRKPGC